MIFKALYPLNAISSFLSALWNLCLLAVLTSLYHRFVIDCQVLLLLVSIIPKSLDTQLFDFLNFCFNIMSSQISIKFLVVFFLYVYVYDCSWLLMYLLYFLCFLFLLKTFSFFNFEEMQVRRKYTYTSNRTTSSRGFREYRPCWKLQACQKGEGWSNWAHKTAHKTFYIPLSLSLSLYIYFFL